MIENEKNANNKILLENKIRERKKNFCRSLTTKTTATKILSTCLLTNYNVNYANL